MFEFAIQPLVLTVVLPLLAGLVCLFIPRSMGRLLALIAVACAGVVTYLAWRLFVGGMPGVMLPAWFDLRLDRLNGFILVGVAAFSLLVALYSAGFMEHVERKREYYAYLLWTLGVSCGAVLANDLILLMVFWGLMGVTLYLMIGIGGPGASSAAKKSLVVVGGADALLVLGVVLLWTKTGTTTISAIAGSPIHFTGGSSYVAFLCIAVAALAKAGAMPFHSWVPDCGEKAPVPVSALLPASLDKLLGIYLLTRLAIHMYAITPGMNTLLMFVGAGTVICAVMMALVQHDLKRLMSYHAVSQVGYMVMGIGTGTAIGLAGGLFHMVNHAIYKTCLFLCAGAVEKRTGTTDLDKLGGLALAMPVTFAGCVISVLSISGIPPLNGFVSKWMVYQGIVESGAGPQGGSLWVIWLAAAMIGSALTLASFVKVLHAVFLRKPSPQVSRAKIHEVGFSMAAPIVILGGLSVLFGVFAYRGPIAAFIGPAVGGKIALAGTWSAGPATAVLVLGYVLGLAIYWLGSVRKARKCPSYIGGEAMDRVYVSGSPVSTARDIEVTGVDFYRTFEEMFPLRAVYSAAARKMFDLYEMGVKAVFFVVEALRALHSGRLPVYMTWVLFGFLALLWALVYGGRLI